jgi:hypothetical protein
LRFTKDNTVDQTISGTFRNQYYPVFARFIKAQNTSPADWFELSQIYHQLNEIFKPAGSPLNLDIHTTRISELFKATNWHQRLLTIDWLAPAAYDLRISFCQGIQLSKAIKSTDQNNPQAVLEAIECAAHQTAFLCYLHIQCPLPKNPKEHIHNFFRNYINSETAKKTFKQAFNDTIQEFGNLQADSTLNKPLLSPELQRQFDILAMAINQKLADIRIQHHQHNTP